MPKHLGVYCESLFLLIEAVGSVLGDSPPQLQRLFEMID